MFLLVTTSALQHAAPAQISPIVRGTNSGGLPNSEERTRTKAAPVGVTSSPVALHFDTTQWFGGRETQYGQTSGHSILQEKCGTCWSGSVSVSSCDIEHIEHSIQRSPHLFGPGQVGSPTSNRSVAGAGTGRMPCAVQTVP